ncbi:protein GDAP2 homolog isoform X1 [Eupeodes corollae]|uniref:protein GDAP2 homolog isoform X1 n=2 Tax=Eupeodes corollae TaxID=290404 RepID=UPI0024900EEF|nr:protein GDAP2 homolog isoform X1 [Eupeodes corollae]
MRLDSNSNEDFKSLGAKINKIKIETLSKWGGLEKNLTTLPATNYSSVVLPRHSTSPFPVSDNINSRLIIWDGDITLLEVDAITNTTDETLTESNIISDRVLAAAGNQLKDELQNHIKECRTGEVQVTKGYNLPALYIIHTVGPIYKNKFKTAAENTLHYCYRNVLYKAKELNLKTIALCNISTIQRNFPADLEAHIALRTIRRFLERFQSEIVILCVDAHERGIYEVLAPLYFPRDQLEESTALWQLPKDIGGEFGEPHHPDRQIRIIRNPQHTVKMRHTDDESDSNPHEMDGNNSDVECGLSDLNGMSLNSYHSNGPNTFAQLQQGDLDRQRLLGDRQRNGVYESVIEDGLEGLEHQERYERLLRRAQVEDLNEVSGIGCLYQSGVDRLGRPVIVFCGKWFPAQDIDLEKALLYLIKLLDPIVKSDYVIAYFHTLTSTNNYPSLHWLREVYSVLPYKYKKNLKAFYIVHPTFWTKMMTWWFTTFMAPAIKAKVHSLPGVEHLYSAISKDQLEIPAYITEYDMATNGLHYFTPVQTPT